MSLFKEFSWDVNEDSDRLVQGLFMQSQVKFKKKKKKLKRGDRKSDSRNTDSVNEVTENKKSNESPTKKKSKLRGENDATARSQQRKGEHTDSGFDNQSMLSKKKKQQKKGNKDETNQPSLEMVPDNRSPPSEKKNKNERNRERSEVHKAFIAERESSPRRALFQEEIRKINQQKQAEKSKSLTRSKKKRDKSIDHKTVDSGVFDLEKNTGSVECDFSRFGMNCGRKSGKQGEFQANQSDAQKSDLKSTNQHKCETQKKRKRNTTEMPHDNENMCEITSKKKRKKDSLHLSTKDNFMQEKTFGIVEQKKLKSENTEDNLSVKRRNKKRKTNLRQLSSSDDLRANQKLPSRKQNSYDSGGNLEVTNKDNCIEQKHGLDTTQKSPPDIHEANMSNLKKKKKRKIMDSGFSETSLSSSLHRKSHAKQLKTEMSLGSEPPGFSDTVGKSPNKTVSNKVPFTIQKLKSVLSSQGQVFQQTNKKKRKHTTLVKPEDEKTEEKYKMDSKRSPDHIGLNIKSKDGSHGDNASLNQRMQERLQGARFRYLNERLYTSTGREAYDMFTEDETAFMAYHQGYQTQVAKWPVNPVQKMINYIRMRPKSWVVADFGCGDAAIARTVQQTVHSFDLVALNKHVTACDMSKVPLKDNSVDIAVFCLSLMGTNLVDFLCEANRVLKKGGILLVAEVVSRMEKIGKFIHKVQKMGFQALSKDTSNKMFVWIEFNKTGRPEPGRIPKIELMPCVYKRR